MATARGVCLAGLLAAALCLPLPVSAATGAGTYAADLPTASGCGRRMLLELFTDNSFVFVQRYLCRPWSPAQLQTGTWRSENDTLVLSSEAQELLFAPEGDGLEYLGTRYGKAGLRLERLK